VNKSKFFNAFSSKITLSRRAIVASVLAVTIFPSVSFVLIHPPTALALDCNDCTKSEGNSGGGGVFGGGVFGGGVFGGGVFGGGVFGGGVFGGGVFGGGVFGGGVFGGSVSGGGAVDPSALTPPPGWEIFLKNTEPATALDVPGRGEPGVSAVLDGVPGSALSTPGGDAGSAPDNKTSPEEAQCRAKCHSSKICLADC